MSIGYSVLAIFAAFAVVGCAGSSRFDQLFRPSWAMDHFTYEGEVLRMKLDKYSGAGFSSKSKYLFGKVTVQIKLVEGDSAGTVTAFYMSSDGAHHNEFDFEFLGNTTGEPYLVQTNIYVNGVGNREQRLKLWFDPTKDFHSYSLLWNQRHVVFLVGETPIRVHSNLEHKGIPYPKDQPMRVYSSIWNADDWATRGGLVKTDWSHAPFVASYTGFQIDGCKCPEANNVKGCSGGVGNKWDGPNMSELSVHQSYQLIWVRSNHMTYDYCSGRTRLGSRPSHSSAGTTATRRWCDNTN